MSCTIIVTDANTLTRPIHDRMPVLLDKADIESWLNGTGGTELLRPAADDRLRMWPLMFFALPSDGPPPEMR
jgi:putative SOS response-associated peptidase YedK